MMGVKYALYNTYYVHIQYIQYVHNVHMCVCGCYKVHISFDTANNYQFTASFLATGHTHKQLSYPKDAPSIYSPCVAECSCMAVARGNLDNFNPFQLVDDAQSELLTFVYGST